MPRTSNVLRPNLISRFVYGTLTCLLLSLLSVQADEAPLKIGVLVTLTGPFAQLGADGADGIKLAVDVFGGKLPGVRSRFLQRTARPTRIRRLRRRARWLNGTAFNLSSVL
jgi:hypothetical protein